MKGKLFSQIAGATLSSVAQSAGWSSEIWDFSGSVPVLK